MSEVDEKIKFEHYRCDEYGELRRYYRNVKNNWVPAPRGGLTICTITDGNGREFHGTSSCSRLDSFSYKMGRRVALGRAQKEQRLAR